MNTLGFVLALASLLSAPPTVSGRVLDAAGAPVSGARVFLEPGLAGALVEVRAGDGGAFSFDDVPPGLAGIFAIADGHAFGGTSVTVAVADAIKDVAVQLGRPAAVSGKIVDSRNKPVQGARITRVLLMSPGKVSIPFAKLQALGFSEPVSAADGSFTVSQLPEGASVALKVGHPDFAQAGAIGIAVGDTKAKVTMSPGVLVRGRALARGGQNPVANAQIILKRAIEPHDAVVTRTDASGNFASRLEPGPYFAQAATAEYRSASWEQVNVSGETPEVRVTLYVGGVGTVTGVVADAATAKPIQGAKISLSARNNVVSRVSTGPTGEFSFDAAEGENIVTFESAPGFLAPEQTTFKVSVVQGKSVNLPTFWLVTAPTYGVQVVDADIKPVPGAVVTVIRPAQFGWRLTDGEGRVSLQIANLPPDGVVVGMVEHPVQPLGALFALDRTKANNSQVLLLPLGTVVGGAANGKGKALDGAVVGAVFAEPPFADDVLLWQTLTHEGGAFEWNSVVPRVSLQFVAKAGSEKVGQSSPATFEMTERKDIGRIVVEEGVAAKSLFGKELKWRDNPLLNGTLPAPGRPVLVVYCSSTEVAAVVEGLAVAQSLFKDALAFAVVVNGVYGGNSGTVPVLRGTSPGTATTYLVDKGGKVALETFGMPPLRALQQVALTTP